MSANNAARFYWAKLRKATTIFEGGDLEQAQDICCQIGNDLRSPKFCQIEAWKLRSRCLPSQHDHWLAKSNLEQALGVCEDCKSDTIEAMELGSKGVTTEVKAAEATAQELQELPMSQAVKDDSDSEMGEAGGVPLPPSPAGSE